MSLAQELPEAIEEEKQIQQDIFDAIDNCQNIIFNAGAGAGKTYSLIESLRYIINNKAEKLAHHNQNIICITYTNVATNEIKERLGNTKLVKVSTIHERLWDLISLYRKQLVEIHIEKLNVELENIQDELDTEAKFQAYRDISNKDNFIDLMIEYKCIYYQNKDKNAAGFRDAIRGFLDEKFCGLLERNVSHFKSLVGKLYKIKNYQICLEKIELGEYKQVVYDARYNNDRLHKMMISHDTLLEYAHSLIGRYDMVRQIIIDKYPFILVDEYQDTAEKAIRILKLLDDHSQQINHNLFKYENVVIVMQNDFGRDRNKFPYFFNNYSNESNLIGDDKEKFVNTKNLLYVSCSRAIKNLRIFYIDDISVFRSGIKSIFGDIYEYQALT